MFVSTNEKSGILPIPEERLQAIASGMLLSYGMREAEFSLTFVEPEEIQSLNNEFRQVNSVTDVLTFCSGGEVDPETGEAYLGDILICTKRAQEQADLSGHSIENEICLLLIHGILHLMDYDHDTDEKKAEMWHEQEHFLNEFHVELKRKPGEDFDF